MTKDKACRPLEKARGHCRPLHSSVSWRRLSTGMRWPRSYAPCLTLRSLEQTFLHHLDRQNPRRLTTPSCDPGKHPFAAPEVSGVVDSDSVLQAPADGGVGLGPGH